jgi:hypothetical protein
MLTLGNVHRVVPKGANRGLNGNSAQPMGTARNRCLGSSREYELAAILWPCRHLDFHNKKSPPYIFGKKNRAHWLSQAFAPDHVVFF